SCGATTDFLNYKAHVTITYGEDAPVVVEPYDGPLVFGPEEWNEADSDWTLSYVEKGDCQLIHGHIIEKKEEILDRQPMVGVGGRKIEPFDDDTYHIPFKYDPGSLSYLNPHQVPWVLDAITHPDDLPVTQFPLNQMVAIKGRVSRKTVTKHLD